MAYTWKKWVTHEKRVTLGKIGHIWKMCYSCKNGSRVENV